MKVQLIHIGTLCHRMPWGPPIHWYKLIAENGLIQEERTERYLPNGIYDMPDEDWDPNKEFEGDVDDDEEYLLCSPSSRNDRSEEE